MNAKNEYNLNIPRYIDSQEAEDIQDIEAHLLGGIPKRDIDELENYWKVYPTLKSNLICQAVKEKNISILMLKRMKLKIQFSIILNLYEFSKKMDKVFKKWATKLLTM